MSSNEVDMVTKNAYDTTTVQLNYKDNTEMPFFPSVVQIQLHFDGPD